VIIHFSDNQSRSIDDTYVPSVIPHHDDWAPNLEDQLVRGQSRFLICIKHVLWVVILELVLHNSVGGVKNLGLSCGKYFSEDVAVDDFLIDAISLEVGRAEDGYFLKKICCS
jgi:hypothetical protein